jgi:hypothetical protein
MSDEIISSVEFEDEGDELDVAAQLPPNQVAAVVSGTDWTTETIVKQLERGNILLNPKFQRRDAWKRDRKSRFIESLIVGLPIPQIVLAESNDDRGKFIVLDGKQRLLAILQFWGHGHGQNNAYSLSGLTLRCDLKGKSFQDLSNDAALEGDFNSLMNQSIRTVVIRNWRNSNFLHTVFLRLNTGSVTLSPQELRQALIPGPFTNYVDEAAGNSPGLKRLLDLSEPDARMRDIEILARYLAFRLRAAEYPGRMKEFLDASFTEFNKKWAVHEQSILAAVREFEAGVLDLLRVFGDELARKPGSRQFNRAIFDALIYYHSQKSVRAALKGKDNRVKTAYQRLFKRDTGFSQAVERDTAGAVNTELRLRLWADSLSKIAGKTFSVPAIPIGTVTTKKARTATKPSRKR